MFIESTFRDDRTMGAPDGCWIGRVCVAQVRFQECRRLAPASRGMAVHRQTQRKRRAVDFQGFGFASHASGIGNGPTWLAHFLKNGFLWENSFFPPEFPAQI
jgi:hypothetical protein